MGLGRVRPLLGTAVAVAIGFALKGAGWPWYAYVPAGVLAGLSTSAIWVIAWYVARKVTYPPNAERQRRLLAEERRETMEAKDSDGPDDTGQGVPGDGE